MNSHVPYPLSLFFLFFFELIPAFFTIRYGYRMMLTASRQDEDRSLWLGFGVVFATSLFSLFYSHVFLPVAVLSAVHMVLYHYNQAYHASCKRQATRMDLRRQLKTAPDAVFAWFLFISSHDDTLGIHADFIALLDEAMLNMPAFLYATTPITDETFQATFKKLRQIYEHETAYQRYLDTDEATKRALYQPITYARDEIIHRFNQFHTLDRAMHLNEEGEDNGNSE